MSRRLTAHLTVGSDPDLLLCCQLQRLAPATLRDRDNRHHASGIWNLPPVALLALAGEFKGLMADYLTMEAGAQLGTELVRKSRRRTHGRQKTVRLAEHPSDFCCQPNPGPLLCPDLHGSAGLAPLGPGKHGGGNPGDPENRRQKSALGLAAHPFHGIQRLLLSSINRERPGKSFWRPQKRHNAPPFLAILGARLAQKGGETETAIVIMKSMLADKNPEEPGYTDMVDRLQALEGVLGDRTGRKPLRKNHGPQAFVPRRTNRFRPACRTCRPIRTTLTTAWTRRASSTLTGRTAGILRPAEPSNNCPYFSGLSSPLLPHLVKNMLP